MADTPYRVGHMHAKPFRIGRLLARIGVLLSAWTMAASAPLHAQAADPGFDTYVQSLWPKAQARGVSRGVLHKNTASRKMSRLSKRVAAL